MLNPLFCWRSNIAMNSSLLTGFIKITFAGKDQQKPLALKGVFYRGLTQNLPLFIFLSSRYRAASIAPGKATHLLCGRCCEVRNRARRREYHNPAKIFSVCEHIC
jgi:hypothetical protein